MSKFLQDLIHQHTTNTLREDSSAIAELAKVERMNTDLTHEVEAIAEDSRLAPEGKADKSRDAARETLAKLEKWHGPLRTGHDEREKNILGQLHEAVIPPRPSDPSERMEAALLRGEVRRKAEGMNAQQLELLYRQRDATIRLALEELPNITVKNNTVIVAPFITKELQTEVLLETGRSKRPDLAKMLDAINEKRQVFQTIVATFRREIERVAPGAVEPAAAEVIAS